MWPRARVRTRLVVNSPFTVAVYCDDAVFLICTYVLQIKKEEAQENVCATVY